MPKLRKNRIREARIHNEAIVDAYGQKNRLSAGITTWKTKFSFPSRLGAWPPK